MHWKNLIMFSSRRIALNIFATYGRSLYALAIGLFCGRWTLMALGEVDYGLIVVVGGLTAFIAFLKGIAICGTALNWVGLRDGKGCGTNGLWIGRLLFGKLCER